MTAHYSPEYGERLSAAMETALRHAFDGLLVVGDAVVRQFETGGHTGLLEALGLHAAVTPQERNRRIRARKADMDRVPWPGMREALHGQDRIALDLRHALRAAPDAVPAADPEIVKQLWLMKGFGRDGDVISLHGVPVPASAEQVRYYTVLRYRPLFSPLADPARIYRGDQAYDAVNTSDTLQERIILVSTRGYRDTLIALMAVNFDLFVAIWLRQIARADRLIDGMAPADLPPYYGRSKIGNRKTRLRITCAVMNEYERGFDLLHALRDEVGVSRQSVRDALKACSSIGQVHRNADGTHRYIAGSAGHIRVMHPTMNKNPPASRGDPSYAQVKNGFAHSTLHVGRFRRVRSITADPPARLFCGVEPAMLLAVMLIQMVETMVNRRGTTLRGAKFSNGNLSGILSRVTYTGVYYDKTVDDDGNVPDPEDWIAVPCPPIIDQPRFDRVNALRASRNPRRTAPHIAAGTTMLTGIAKCGTAGCSCAMTIRTGKGGRYSYYVCANRVNKGQACATPSIPRKVLDDLVLDSVEKQVLAPERLRTLLSDALDLSDQKRVQREAELTQARAEKARRSTAIERLYIAMEEGDIGPRDPIFAKRMEENRSALAASTTRIATLETQLAKGSRKITPNTINRFGELLSARLRDDDPALRKTYLRMLVSKVTVSNEQITITGPKAVLENGVCNGAPRLMGMVPIFDREWCRLRDSNT